MWDPSLPREKKDELYEIQERWEHTYLDECISRMRRSKTFKPRQAAIMFWCAAEVEHFPARAYAQTTRIEVGTVLGYFAALSGQRAFRPNKMGSVPREGIFVGADEKFSGRRYLSGLLENHWRPFPKDPQTTREAVLEFLDEF